MSTVPPSVPPTRSADEVEIKLVSHSNLFYWWPVWAVGYLMAILTYIDNQRLVVVPKDTEVKKAAEVSVEKGPGDRETTTNREVVTLPAGKSLDTDLLDSSGHLKLHIASTGAYGVIFLITVLVVIVITNVSLRGMVSVAVIITIGMGTIILALSGWLKTLIEQFILLDIRITMGGYLLISTGLFILWLFIFFLFDRSQYIVFSPGSMKVCTEIGGGEKAYDTMGMTLEKKRSDLFRHWILGLGSGDLIVNTSGASATHIEMPNVLFIGKKVQLVEDMLREKAVVKGR